MNRILSLLVLFFISSVTYSQYFESGEEFYTQLMIGRIPSYSFTFPQVKAKFIKRDGHYYTFEFDSVFMERFGLGKNPTWLQIDGWNHTYLQAKQEADKKFKDTKKTSENNYPEGEDVAAFKSLVKEHKLTFCIPTFTTPIPLEKDTTYFLSSKAEEGFPSTYQFFILKNDQLYFAGASEWKIYDIIYPKNFPLKIELDEVLTNNFLKEDLFFYINLSYKYSSPKKSVVLTQGECKEFENWTIYQGVANHQILLVPVLDAGANEISFTVVKTK